jgi:hypothetical protein
MLYLYGVATGLDMRIRERLGARSSGSAAVLCGLGRTQNVTVMADGDGLWMGVVDLHGQDVACHAVSAVNILLVQMVSDATTDDGCHTGRASCTYLDVEALGVYNELLANPFPLDPSLALRRGSKGVRAPLEARRTSVGQHTGAVFETSIQYTSPQRQGSRPNQQGNAPHLLHMPCSSWVKRFAAMVRLMAACIPVQRLK